MTGTTVTVLAIVVAVLVLAIVALRHSVGRLTSDVQAHLNGVDQGLPRLFAVQSDERGSGPGNETPEHKSDAG